MKTPQYGTALLPRADHNRCSAGWLRTQLRVLDADLARAELSGALIRQRIAAILAGKE